MLVGVLGILLSTQAVHAGTFYDFVEDGTGTILAQVTLEGDEPWDHFDVSRLTITEAGDAVLALGIGEYGGLFDETDLGFKTDLAGDGLIGNTGLNGSITDNEDLSRISWTFGAASKPTS